MLRVGMRGPDVSLYQVKLNIRQAPHPLLKADGIFGPKTDAATHAFQRANGLVADGIVGPRTAGAIDAGPPIRVREHPIRHIPQPTPTTCWAAATAMMTNSTVQAAIARTPPDMIAADGGLLNSSESDQAVVTGTRYGQVHGLRCYAPMSWSTSAFVTLIAHNPIALDMLWRTDEYVAGRSSPGHFVVVSGTATDSAGTGANTYVKILDPWPPTVGKISWEGYEEWMREVPTRTYRVFQR